MKKRVLPIVLAFTMLMFCTGCSVFSDLGSQIMGTESNAEPVVISEYYDPAEAAAEAEAALKAARQELSAEEVSAQLALSVVTVTAYDAKGHEITSGIGFFTTGGVVTALSTVSGADHATVTQCDCGVYPVTGVHYFDQNMNFAVLACPKQQAPDLTAGAWETEVDDLVYVLGADSSANSGMLLSSGQIINGYDCASVSADINEGNNGGPVVNAYGDLVGAALYNPAGDGQSYVFSTAALSSLDLSQTVSLEQMNSELSYEVPADGTQVITGDDGEAVYENADTIEAELNDDAVNADVLSDSLWTAAYVNVAGREYEDVSEETTEESSEESGEESSEESSEESGEETSEETTEETAEKAQRSNAELLSDSVDIFTFTVEEAGIVDIYLKPYYSEDVEFIDGTWLMAEQTEEESTEETTEESSEETSEESAEETTEETAEEPVLIHLKDDSGDTGFFSALEQDGCQYQHAQCQVEAGTYYVQVKLLDGWQQDIGCYYTVSYTFSCETGE